MCFPPCLPCEPLCGSMPGGAGPLPLPEIPGQRGPLVCRFMNGPSTFLMALRRTQRQVGYPKLPHLPTRRKSPVPPVPAPPGERILPTFGWGKQSVWLAASGSQTLFCGQKPAPTLPARGRSAERKNRPWLQQHISAAYQVLTRNTKKRKFLSEHSLPLRFPPCLPL